MNVALTVCVQAGAGQHGAAGFRLGKLATHDDVVDGNVDELHEKANEAHNQEPGGGARGTRQAL